MKFRNIIDNRALKSYSRNSTANVADNESKTQQHDNESKTQQHDNQSKIQQHDNENMMEIVKGIHQ